MAGIKEGRKLEVLNSDGPLSAANMGEENRKKLGITERMPLSWKESMGAFSSDELLRHILGRELIDKYLAVSEVSFFFRKVLGFWVTHACTICRLLLG
jgi:glutamine synthetase